MPWHRFGLVSFLLALFFVTAPPSTSAQLWKNFVPVSRAKAVPEGDYRLSDKHGPWLVMAATFSEEGAEEQAKELALEFREHYRLPAYIHPMTFQFSDKSPGRGVDKYGAPIRRRFRRNQSHEFAVLVGGFPSVDDPEAQKLLRQIKTLEPETLNLDERKKTSQSMAGVRQFQNALLEKMGKERKRGPMGQAFLARNPLLPREYFVPQGVDDFVLKMNKRVKHGLLDCPGKYTVQVATFRGKTILQTNHTEPKSSKSLWKWKKNKPNDTLMEAAENAHLLAEKLRDHGWEAYEFHNRTESLVTIGSFDQAAQRLANGQLAATPPIQKILRTFGAQYDTPADPLSDLGNDGATQRKVEQQQRQFSQVLSSQEQGKITPGMHPKHIKIYRNRRFDRVIPMDVHPHVINVPKRSVSSAYVRQ